MEDSSPLRLCTAYMPPLDYFASLLKSESFLSDVSTPRHSSSEPGSARLSFDEVGLRLGAQTLAESKRTFIVDVRETYRKQTFRNRALIITSQGVQVLSVPCIKTSGNHTPVGEVAVDNSKKWRQHHWRSICTAYNRSPFFLYYRDELETILYHPWNTLLELNNALTDFFIAKLKLPVQRVQIPEQQEYALPLDFTDKTPPRYCFDSYLQTFPSTVPSGHLSVLDLLFNTGPEAALFLAGARLVEPVSLSEWKLRPR